MSDETGSADGARTRLESADLSLVLRVGLALGGLAAVVLAFVYALNERFVLVAAPQCASIRDGESCVLRVSASADPALLISLFVLAGLCLLLAVSGVVPTMRYGGAEVSFARASFASTPRDRQGSSLLGRVEASPFARPFDSGTRSTNRVQSLERISQEQDLLWAEVPSNVRTAAQLAWARRHEDSLLRECLEEVRRKPGKGSHAWFFAGRAPGAEKTEWIRVTTGGRGKRDPDGNFNEGPDAR